MSVGTTLRGQKDKLEVHRDDSVDVSRLEDGAVVTSQEDGTTYVAQQGRLQQVLDPHTVLRSGFDPDTTQRLTLPSADIAQHLQSDQPMAFMGQSAVAAKNFDSGDVFLGSGHYMRTWGQVDAMGRVAATTRIRTITWFGGYHGGVHVIFANSDDAPVYTSQDHRYGVDGTWVGTSDRTEAWFEQMDASRYGDIHRIYIFQSWQPDSFQTILDKWVAAGKSVASLAGSVGDIAKVVAAVV